MKKYGILIDTADERLLDTTLRPFLIYKSGSLPLRYPGGSLGVLTTQEVTIEHNLGYPPVCYVYIRKGGVQSPAGYYNLCTYNADEKNLYVTVANYGNPAPGDVAAFDYVIEYYIQYQKINLDDDLNKRVVKEYKE
jgi:hypothetical protein